MGRLEVRNSTTANSSAEHYYVVLIVDKDRPEGHLGFQAGEAVVSGQRLLKVFLNDDGGALAVSTSDRESVGGPSVLVTLTIAEPGAMPPTKAVG